MENLKEQLEALESKVKVLESKNLALDQELRRFYILADNISDQIYFKDPACRFSWVNQNMITVRGLKTRQDLIGKTSFDIHPLDRAQAARLDDEEIMRTGLPILNKLQSDKYADGSPRWLITSKIPFQDDEGKVIGICGISKDFTKMILAEEILVKESALRADLLENLPDGIWFKDLDGRYTWVNRSILRHFKMEDLAEIQGKTDFEIFPLEHARRTRNDELNIMENGFTVVNLLEHHDYGNGNIRWVFSTKIPLHDSQGALIGTCGINHDITELRQAEEALRLANEGLEAKVEARTADLVLEIKNHLHTELALVEGKNLLKEANSRLESRIGQLNFLNSAAINFARHSAYSDLLPVIVQAFASSLPGIEVSLCILKSDGFDCVSTTNKIDSPIHRKAFAALLDVHFEKLPTETILISDRKSHPILGTLALSVLGDLPVYMVLPLVTEGMPLAVIQIFASEHHLPSLGPDNLVLQTIAALAALSLSNAKNFRELERKTRIAGELEVAQTIQRRFTPSSKPQIPGVNLMGVYIPANEVGGDYLDYFQTEQGNWVVVLADVSGKGIPAALLMTVLRTNFRAESRYRNSAKSLLCAVNDLMIKDLDELSFITAICLMIDHEGNTMSYARAGHPPMVQQEKAGTPFEVKPKGLALGILEGTAFANRIEEHLIELSPGQRYLLFTDGLPEVMDHQRNFYGMNRVMHLLPHESNIGPEKVLKLILEDVQSFRLAEPYHDDMSILVLEITGKIP